MKSCKVSLRNLQSCIHRYTLHIKQRNTAHQAQAAEAAAVVAVEVAVATPAADTVSNASVLIYFKSYLQNNKNANLSFLRLAFFINKIFKLDCSSDRQRTCSWYNCIGTCFCILGISSCWNCNLSWNRCKYTSCLRISIICCFHPWSSIK